MGLAFSAEQMEALAMGAFLSRVVTLLVDADPSARDVLSDPDGHRILYRQYQRALSYGLTSELDLGRYIITAWLLGTDFDTRFPAMSQILNSPELTSGEKAQAIEDISITLFDVLDEDQAR